MSFPADIKYRGCTGCGHEYRYEYWYDAHDDGDVRKADDEITLATGQSLFGPATSYGPPPTRQEVEDHIDERMRA